MMLIRDLEQIKRLFNRLDGPVIGVGMTAFSRIVPASFLPSYRIICNQKTCDLSLVREKVPVLCLGETVEDGCFNEVENSFQLLSSRYIANDLSRQKGPKYLFLYQNYSALEGICEEKGWVLLANPSELRVRTGERSFFERAVSYLGLPKIPGGIFPWGVMAGREYENWMKELGPKFVVQLPEIKKGGGKGTFFVKSKRDYDSLRKRLASGIWRGARLTSVLVRRFLEGIPASVAICATRSGVLISGLQKQLIDLPYCRGLQENGIFCGHVWDEGIWSALVSAKARELAQKVGNYLASLGYRGIAGIDFIVQPDEEEVYCLEINPRLTGAFPVLSLLHLRQNIVPMEAFHLLEFLNIPYQLDLESLNRRYARPLLGSQILLFCGVDGKAESFRPLRAGIWEYNRKKRTCSFLKESIDLEETREPGQFIVADGPPAGGIISSGPADPLRRLCRIIFPCSLEKEKGLREEIPAIAEWIRKRCVG